MNGTYIENECSTEDVYFAAFLHYLGYEVLKINAGGTTKFFFQIPSCDFEICKSDYTDSPISSASAFVNSVKSVFSFQTSARQNMGEWQSQTWRELIRQRIG